MKEIRNYKNIRRKPQIHGFSPIAFYIFTAGLLLSLLTLSGGFTFAKLVGILIFNAISYIITRLVISNDILMKKLLDEKFPKEISHLTRKIIKNSK